MVSNRASPSSEILHWSQAQGAGLRSETKSALGRAVLFWGLLAVRLWAEARSVDCVAVPAGDDDRPRYRVQRDWWPSNEAKYGHTLTLGIV